MLTPEQVIPFLSSDDPILREHAARYFNDFDGNIAPLTADICWEDINRIGLRRAANKIIRLLPLTPQNDASTRQLLAALDAPSDPPTRAELFNVLSQIDFEQLRLHREQILARPDLPDNIRYRIMDRLELALAPVEAIWARFEEQARLGDEAYWNELDHTITTRLIEALVRHGQPSIDRALAIVNDPESIEKARAIFAINLLASARYRPVMETLLQIFIDSAEDDDVLHQAIQDGLPRIGGLDLVAPLEAVYLDQSWTFHLYAAEIFSRIHHPDVEAALIRLFDDPRSDQSRDQIADALFNLCTTDALPRLASLVLSGKYDSQSFNLQQDLVACSLMAGFDFPELPAMREEVVARDAIYRKRLEAGEFDHSPIDDLDDDLYEDDFDDDYEDDEMDSFLPALPPSRDDRQPVVEPIRNETPKIGRNDPCPCGSGKKYKKCCLK
jgi:hypothetical protein